MTLVEASDLRLSGSAVMVRGLGKRFGDQRALDGVDLDVEPGSVTCLLGPSGSGKSTLLRCINRLEMPDAGMVFVDAEPMGFRRRGDDYLELSSRDQARQRAGIGMVFQQFNLFAHRTVIENVIEGPLVHRIMVPREARRRAIELLDRVGLANKAE